jgi:intein/homing endonuclease
MDNQHATPTDLAYLAGLFDGEGCIRIQRQTLKGKHIGYACNVKITNSDPNIIERAQSIILTLGVNPLIRELDNTKNPQWKSWFDVYLTKQSSMRTVLDAILPYLVGKKARAIIMLRYIDKTIEREEAYLQLKELNHKGEPSETTREAPVKQGEDIVHAAGNPG